MYAPDTGHCVYSLSDQDTLNNHLPVTCLRWRPTLEGDTYGNMLLATCKLVRCKLYVLRKRELLPHLTAVVVLIIRYSYVKVDVLEN